MVSTATFEPFYLNYRNLNKLKLNKQNIRSLAAGPSILAAMARYDEDLHENLFFNTLVSKYSDLFSEAAEKKWMVSPRWSCVAWGGGGRGWEAGRHSLLERVSSRRTEEREGDANLTRRRRVVYLEVRR